MSELKKYTITIFSEDHPGILARVVGIITRRHINIESINGSPSAIAGIHKIIVVVNVSNELIKKLVGQLDKQVDILKAFYYEDSEIVFQEIALYKVPSKAFYNGNAVETLVRKFDARVLRIEQEYIVIEKTGHFKDTEALYEALKEFGIYEFVRSGRVAIVKQMERLNTYLKNIELKKEIEN